MPESALPNEHTWPQNTSLPIMVRNLQYVVAGKFLVDIDAVEISAGGPTIILGSNGAGKSIFMRLLHGLIEPTHGAVLCADKLPDRALRRRQAMVFQKPVLLRRTVAANIAYSLKVHGVPRKNRRLNVQTLLRQCGLSDLAKQSARTLSGGEQQRLAIVRALASKPEVLFLDEPTSSLDPAASDLIEDMIKRASTAGTKIVMITQDLGLARRLAENVILMHRGRVIEHTPSSDFFNRPVSTTGRDFLDGSLANWGDNDG